MRIWWITMAILTTAMNVYAVAAYGSWLVNGIAALVSVWAGSIWWRAEE